MQNEKKVQHLKEIWEQTPFCNHIHYMEFSVPPSFDYDEALKIVKAGGHIGELFVKKVNVLVAKL